MGTPDALIEKIMSLSLGEFHRGLRVLSPGIELEDNQRNATLPVGDGSVTIVYEPLEEAALGGLLNLPRARITIDHRSLDAHEVEVFVNLFDKAFQRGGG